MRTGRKRFFVFKQKSKSKIENKKCFSESTCAVNEYEQPDFLFTHSSRRDSERGGICEPIRQRVCRHAARRDERDGRVEFAGGHPSVGRAGVQWHRCSQRLD